MIVRAIDDNGFETDEDYFTFDEIRKLYFLTYHGYNKAINERRQRI